MNFSLYQLIQQFYDLCDTFENKALSGTFANVDMSFREILKAELMSFICRILSKGNIIGKEAISCLNYYFDLDIPTGAGNELRSKGFPAAEKVMQNMSRDCESGSLTVELLVQAENFALKQNVPLTESSIDAYVQILYALSKEFLTCDGDISLSKFEVVSDYISKIKLYVRGHHLKKGMLKCLQ